MWPQFTFQMHPPFLSYMDNCLELNSPHSASYHLHSSPTWQTLSRLSIDSKPCLHLHYYCPKTTRSSGLVGTIQSGSCSYIFSQASQSKQQNLWYLEGIEPFREGDDKGLCLKVTGFKPHSDPDPASLLQVETTIPSQTHYWHQPAPSAAEFQPPEQTASFPFTGHHST